MFGCILGKAREIYGVISQGVRVSRELLQTPSPPVHGQDCRTSVDHGPLCFSMTYLFLKWENISSFSTHSPQVIYGWVSPADAPRLPPCSGAAWRRNEGSQSGMGRRWENRRCPKTEWSSISSYSLNLLLSSNDYYFVFGRIDLTCNLQLPRFCENSYLILFPGCLVSSGNVIDEIGGGRCVKIPAELALEHAGVKPRSCEMK